MSELTNLMSQIFLAIISFWLLIISLITAWTFIYFRRLSKDLDKGNLINVLDKILVKEEVDAKEIGELSKAIKRLENDSLYHIQKIGMVRFNPFEEMGGDHSFSLALLDATLSGYVITGLHTRERTRVYVKRVDKGKSKFELSNEEKEAIRKAQK